MVMFIHVLSISHICSLINSTFVASLISTINNSSLNYPWINIGSLGIRIFLVTIMFWVFIADCWRSYSYSLNFESKNNTITTHQYAYLVVYDLLEKPFTIVTLDYIENLLPLLGLSLPGDFEHHIPSEGANYHPS